MPESQDVNPALRFLKFVGRILWKTFKFCWSFVWNLIAELRALVTRVVELVIALPGNIIHFIRWLFRQSLWWFIKQGVRLVVAVAILGSLGMYWLVFNPSTQIPKYEPVDETVYLGQGWGKGRESESRQTYYFTPQGTTLFNLRYSWFVNLEIPWGKKRFADADHMKAYGFIVDPATKHNPDELPLGFTKHYSREVGDYLFHITCAACHTGEVTQLVDGKRYGIRIDGGQAMHAFTADSPPHFAPVLFASMVSTYWNPLKFARFAENVLGVGHSRDERAALWKELGIVKNAMWAQASKDKRKKLYPITEGFGRTDAIGRIANRTFGDRLDSENYRLGDAPVSYPPVWEIWKFDWVQYGASVSQPMARNVGETLGVGAVYRLVSDDGGAVPAKERFHSSTRLYDLDKIEKAMWDLKPPKWPEELLGEINKKRAEKGQILFNTHCRKCHGPHRASDALRAWEAPLKGREYLDQYDSAYGTKYAESYPDGFPHWWVSILPIYDIGTDPKAALNFVNYRFDFTKTGLTNMEAQDLLRPDLKEHHERRKPYIAYLEAESARLKALDDPNVAKPLAEVEACLEKFNTEPEAWIDEYLNKVDVKSVSTGQGLLIAGRLIRKQFFEEHEIPDEKRADIEGFGILDLPQEPLAYKARPLAGIWATPPFLHNGSVPSLYDLLSPVDERPKTFFVGHRDFDTEKVGYEQKPPTVDGFLLDTKIPGNTNTGHEFRSGYVQWKYGDPPQYGVIGPEFSHEERMALVEYLKVHEDTPVEEFKPCR